MRCGLRASGNHNIDLAIDRMAIHDADYNTQLPLTANGKDSLRIAGAEKFLIKISKFFLRAKVD
jgi:hypothetical protein